jgi:predicted membrane metal-binding protein
MPAALRAMSMLDVAGSAGQYAARSSRILRQSISHLIAVSKVLLALANDIIQQPLRFLVQSCFALFALSLLIIAAIVSLASRQPSSQ